MWLTEQGQFGVRSHQTAKSHLIPPSTLSTITRRTPKRFSNLLISLNISVTQRKAIMKLFYGQSKNVLQSHFLRENTVVKIFRTVITLINFYACATRSLDVTEKLKMKFFEQKCRGRYWLSKAGKTTRVWWRKLLNWRLQNVYLSTIATLVLTPQKIQCAKYVVHSEEMRHA